MKITAVLLPPNPASLLDVGGLSVIVRLVLTAHRSGATRVVALGGDETARALDADPRCRDVEVLEGEVPRLGESDVVAVLPSDCLVTPPALEAILAAADSASTLVVPEMGIVIAPPRFVDLERLRRGEATADGTGFAQKPVAEGSSPTGRGQVRGSNDSSTSEGVEEPSNPLTLPLPEGEERQAGGEFLCKADGTVRRLALPSDHGWCMRIRSVADASAAEDRLVADLRSATAESDGPIARFDRALSTRLSRQLVRTPLRPNHITFVGTVVGLMAAWCISSGTYAGGLAGALLFWIAVIIDGCDGEVARLKMRESRVGYLFDVITDNVVHAAIFVAIGLGQYRAAPSESHVLLAVLLMSGLALSLIASYFCLIRHPPVQRLSPRSPKGKLRKRLLLAFEAVMNRDFAYVLLPLALLGRLNWFLWGAGFGSHAFTLGLFVVYRWRDEE